MLAREVRHWGWELVTGRLYFESIYQPRGERDQRPDACHGLERTSSCALGSAGVGPHGAEGDPDHAHDHHITGFTRETTVVHAPQVRSGAPMQPWVAGILPQARH